MGLTLEGDTYVESESFTVGVGPAHSLQLERDILNRTIVSGSPLQEQVRFVYLLRTRREPRYVFRPSVLVDAHEVAFVAEKIRHEPGNSKTTLEDVKQVSGCVVT